MKTRKITKEQLVSMVRKMVKEAIEKHKSQKKTIKEGLVDQLMDMAFDYDEIIEEVIKKMKNEEVIKVFKHISKMFSVPLKKKDIKTQESRIRWLEEVADDAPLNEIFDEIEISLSPKRLNQILLTIIQENPEIEECKMSQKKTIKEEKSVKKLTVEDIREMVREAIREAKGEKWMQKAVHPSRKGELRSKMGAKEGENIPLADLEKKKTALQKKGEGDKKLSAADRKELQQIIFAINARKAKK